MTITITTKMMWHPIGSQVACKVVFRPMPSGRVCNVSGDPLKALSNVVWVLRGHKQTCVLCICLGKCMVMTPPPAQYPSPNPFSSAVQTLLSMSFSVWSHRPPHAKASASCLSSKTFSRVHSWLLPCFPQLELRYWSFFWVCLLSDVILKGCSSSSGELDLCTPGL